MVGPLSALYPYSFSTQKYFLPIHGDVKHISWPHDSLIANNIFKIGKLLIVRVIKINLETKIWMHEYQTQRNLTDPFSLTITNIEFLSIFWKFILE